MGEELDRIEKDVKDISEKLREIKEGGKKEGNGIKKEEVENKNQNKREKTDFSDLHERSHLEQEEMEELEKSIHETREKLKEELWEDIEKPHSRYPGYGNEGVEEEAGKMTERDRKSVV